MNITAKESKYYQGKYIPKFPQKYKGDPTQIIYRSSWELKFFNWCDTNDNVIGWGSEEIVIPYICPTDNRPHRYFVDAHVEVKTKDGQIKKYLVEIKPYAQTQPPKQPKRKSKRFIQEVMRYGKNDAKWAAAKRWCKDRGYEFIILTEHDLNIKY